MQLFAAGCKDAHSHKRARSYFECELTNLCARIKAFLIAVASDLRVNRGLAAVVLFFSKPLKNNNSVVGNRYYAWKDFKHLGVSMPRAAYERRAPARLQHSYQTTVDHRAISIDAIMAGSESLKKALNQFGGVWLQLVEVLRRGNSYKISP